MSFGSAAQTEGRKGNQCSIVNSLGESSSAEWSTNEASGFLFGTGLAIKQTNFF